MVIKLRRDTEANWNRINPILAQAELGLIVNTDGLIHRLKIGDGSTSWVDLQELDLTGSGGEPMTGDEIARALEKLPDEKKLDASAIKGLSSTSIIRFQDKREFDKGEYCFFNGQTYRALQTTAEPPNRIDDKPTEYTLGINRDVLEMAEGNPDLSINQRFIALMDGKITGFTFGGSGVEIGSVGYFILQEVIPEYSTEEESRKVVDFRKFTVIKHKTAYYFSTPIEVDINKEYFVTLHLRGAEGETLSAGFHKKPYVSNPAFMAGSSKGRWASCFTNTDFSFVPVIGQRKRNSTAAYKDRIFTFSPIYESGKTYWEQVTGLSMEGSLRIDVSEGENVSVTVDKEDEKRWADLEYVRFDSVHVSYPTVYNISDVWYLAYNSMNIQSGEYLDIYLPIPLGWKHKPFNIKYPVTNFGEERFEINMDSIELINSPTAIKTYSKAYTNHIIGFKEVIVDDDTGHIHIRIGAGNNWSNSTTCNVELSQNGGTKTIKLFDPISQEINDELLAHPDFLTDAPRDGQTYGRRDGRWSTVENGCAYRDVVLGSPIEKGEVVKMSEDGKVYPVKLSAGAEWEKTVGIDVVSGDSGLSYTTNTLAEGEGLLIVQPPDATDGASIGYRYAYHKGGGYLDRDTAIEIVPKSAWNPSTHRMNNNLIAYFANTRKLNDTGYYGIAKVIQLKSTGPAIKSTYDFETGGEPNILKVAQIKDNEFILLYQHRGLGDRMAIVYLTYDYGTDTFKENSRLIMDRLSGGHDLVKLTDTRVAIVNQGSNEERAYIVGIDFEKNLFIETSHIGVATVMAKHSFALVRMNNEEFLKVGTDENDALGRELYSITPDSQLNKTNLIYYDELYDFPVVARSNVFKVFPIGYNLYGMTYTLRSDEGVLDIISFNEYGNISRTQRLAVSSEGGSVYNPITEFSVSGNGDNISVAITSNVGSNRKSEMILFQSLEEYEPEKRIGILEESGEAGDSKRMSYFGQISKATSGLTPGRKYHLSSSGKIEIGDSQYPMGVALSENELLVKY